ncbi:MAG TPA: hypothetical protein VFY40_08600 [Blastocatellia bacterium]|nr:hypothetical protein [Blastocatellia bacterium]
MKDYFINPRCFGDDCARWLIDRLFSQGVGNLDSQPSQEDWGWRFNIAVGRQCFMVGVGLYEAEASPNTWLVFIESQLGWLSGKLSGKSDETDLSTICKTIDRALKSASEISDVRWHAKEDWLKGKDRNWRSDPDEI